MRTGAQRLAQGHTTGKWLSKDSNSGPLSPELPLCPLSLPKGKHSVLSCDMRQYSGRDQTGLPLTPGGARSHLLSEPSFLLHL